MWVSTASDFVLNESEKTILTFLEYLITGKEGNYAIHMSNDSSSHIRPGDLSSIFKFDHLEHLFESLLVFVCRIDRCRDDDHPNFLLWFSSTFRYSETGLPNLRSEEVVPVSLLMLNRTQGDKGISKGRIQRGKYFTNGKLCTGLNYFVYRILLYSDDFHPCSLLFPRGSVHGLYFQPIGCSNDRRKRLSSIRPITLASHGVSTNWVFGYIIDDLIQSSTRGVSTMDENGTPVLIFIKVVGYVADYLASSYALDTLNHNALSPCTHCFFSRRNKSSRSRYAYSSRIHSYNSTFARSTTRAFGIR